MTIMVAFVPCLAADDQSTSTKDLTYITEQFRPYNYQENGELQGISVVLLEKMWERMGVDLNRSVIKFLPWTEGYQRALNENNTVLFSMARLPQREKLFKWAGPIGPIRDVLLSKKDADISITTPGDLKKYKIGALENTSSLLMLLDKGAKRGDLVLENTSKPIIEMLRNGSIDAWAYGDTNGISLIEDLGLNASDYKTAYVLGQEDYYYAFNKGIPDSVVQSFQEALDYLRGNKDKSGVSDYEKILSKYGPTML